MFDLLIETRERLHGFKIFIFEATAGKPVELPAMGLDGRNAIVWSPRVLHLFMEWQSVVGAAYLDALSLSQRMPEWVSARRAWKSDDRPQTYVYAIADRFTGRVDQAHDLAERLAEQVWRELRGEDAGYLDSHG